MSALRGIWSLRSLVCHCNTSSPQACINRQGTKLTITHRSLPVWQPGYALRRYASQDSAGLAGAAAAALGMESHGTAAAVPQLSPFRRRLGTVLRIFFPVAGGFTLWYGITHPDKDAPLGASRMPAKLQYLAAQQTQNQEVVINWSGTHEAKPKRYFQAESEEEVEQFVEAAHTMGQKLRVVGSALSPNGLALSEEGMLSVALLDKVLAVDQERQQVTVQAGCRVQRVADALKPYGLTLQNYASIREQQVGGFIQVGAHGTGATIPPVDEQVVSMRLVTPALGTLDVSAKDNPELFDLARVGLGALGVVTQVTLQAVPRHQLLEKTFTATPKEVKKNHVRWLREHRHLRYMWLPYTDTVVVVHSNPISGIAPDQAPALVATPAAPSTSAAVDPSRLQPLRDLLVSRQPEVQVEGLSATQLRDHLLELDPLNCSWVTKVNKAEAEVWRRSSGERVGWSDEILGFDCGGQQWVLEVAMPVGRLQDLPTGRSTQDLQYMDTLMAEIARAKVPAPSPIEQRWTAGSSAPMSPAAGPRDSVHSWVGIIMYMPEDPDARTAITAAFKQYTQLVQDKMMDRFKAVWHWAKLEVPESSAEQDKVKARLASRYPVERFNQYRALLDPKGVLSNQWVDTLFGPVVQAQPQAAAKS